MPAAIAQKKAATHRRRPEAPETEGLFRHSPSGQRSRYWSLICHNGILGDDNRDAIYPTAFRKKAATDSEEMRLTL
jgi:hypothetical protein